MHEGMYNIYTEGRIPLMSFLADTPPDPKHPMKFVLTEDGDNVYYFFHQIRNSSRITRVVEIKGHPGYSFLPDKNVVKFINDDTSTEDFLSILSEDAAVGEIFMIPPTIQQPIEGFVPLRENLYYWVDPQQSYSSQSRVMIFTTEQENTKVRDYNRQTKIWESRPVTYTSIHFVGEARVLRSNMMQGRYRDIANALMSAKGIDPDVPDNQEE